MPRSACRKRIWELLPRSVTKRWLPIEPSEADSTPRSTVTSQRDIDRDRLLVSAARADEAAAIADLAAELGYPNSADQVRVRLESLGSRSDHWVGVARSGSGQVLGWVHVGRSITLETGEYAEILGLVVSGAARRAGVGRALVSAAERWSQQAGLDRITVRSNVLRTESHRFYPSLGYTRSKSQHIYVKPLAAER